MSEPLEEREDASLRRVAEKQIENLLHGLYGAQKKAGKQEAVNRLLLNADTITDIISDLASDLAEALDLLITDVHKLELGVVQFAFEELQK